WSPSPTGVRPASSASKTPGSPSPRASWRTGPPRTFGSSPRYSSGSSRPGRRAVRAGGGRDGSAATRTQEGSDMNVLIIGGGIGGLTLAQGLERTGIGFTVFERDRARGERLQGYRIHLAPYGCRALHASLPPALYDLFVATSGEPNRSLAFFDERL